MILIQPASGPKRACSETLCLSAGAGRRHGRYLAERIRHNSRRAGGRRRANLAGNRPAPAEVQVRISQRLAAAFPDLQPTPEKAPAGQLEVRQIPLTADSGRPARGGIVEHAGQSLDRHPGSRTPYASHGYRLALSGGGAVTIWIDQGTRQVKLEGSAAAVNAAARLIYVLDSPQDPAGRNVRLMPLHPAQLASVQRAASIIRTAGGGRRRPFPWRPCSCNRGPTAAAGGRQISTDHASPCFLRKT